MRGHLNTPFLLLTLLLVPLAVVGSMLFAVSPVYAAPDPDFVDSHPTNHVIYGGLGVSTPASAYDQNSATFAAFSYCDLATCVYGGDFEVNTFTIPNLNYSLQAVDFKMKYTILSGNEKAEYRILYYVDPSPTATILQAWTSPIGSVSYDPRVWPDQPEPNDGTWNWTDISNIRFLVETHKIGGGAKGNFEEYEAWVTVTGEKPTTKLYVQPPSFINYALPPEETTIRPMADGTYTDWSGTYVDWDEPVQNGDDDYVSATADNLRESSALEDHTTETWSIARVRVVAYAKTDVATDEQLVLMLGAYSGEVYDLTTNYEKYTSDWGKNPATYNYWTWSDVDALQAGVRSKVSEDEIWTGEIRVTQLYVEVIGPRFTLDMEVSDVEDLWGYTFVCSYNTTVLTATSYTTYSPFTLPWPSAINDEITVVTGEDVGTGNSITTAFYLKKLTVVGGSETVYLDGVPQTRDVDYAIDYETGEITFTTPPTTGVAITADYQQNAYVAVSYSKGFLMPGENTTPPDYSIAVCKVSFRADGPGWSKLYLWSTDLSDSDGVPIYHLPVGGYFSTTAIHDIAVTDVTPTPTSVPVGDDVTITVDVENQGDYDETFNVKTYYDSTPISPDPETTVSLGPRENIMLTFTWDTTDVPEATYTIKANATVVAGETDTADNEFINGSVTVGLPVPEFPLGMAMELALAVAIVYIWRKRKVKIKTKFTPQ